jgi:hypothetical protein
MFTVAAAERRSAAHDAGLNPHTVFFFLATITILCDTIGWPKV